MNREQEILEQLTKLTDEFNMLSCELTVWKVVTIARRKKYVMLLQN